MHRPDPIEIPDEGKPHEEIEINIEEKQNQDESEFMNAVTYQHYGNPQNVLRVSMSFPIPELDPDSDCLLIKVEAASGQNVDCQRILGQMPDVDRQFPVIPGSDFSGVVVAAGSQCMRVQVGDSVFGVCLKGGMAGYIIVREDEAWQKPGNMTHPEAAALGFSALSAYQALKHTAKVKVGHRLLVLGSATATGFLAVQIAKSLGAEYIVAVAHGSEANKLLTTHGADSVLAGERGDWAETLANQVFHIVLDCEGQQSSWRRSQQVLQGQGIFVRLGDYSKEVGRLTPTSPPRHAPSPLRTSHPLTPETASRRPKRSLFGSSLQFHEMQLPAPVDLCNIASLCETGRLVPLIDTDGHYHMSNVLDMFTRLQQNDMTTKSLILFPHEFDDEHLSIRPSITPNSEGRFLHKLFRSLKNLKGNIGTV